MLTLDELIDWLKNLRKSQEGWVSTNIEDIRVVETGWGKASRKIELSVKTEEDDE